MKSGPPPAKSFPANSGPRPGPIGKADARCFATKPECRQSRSNDLPASDWDKRIRRAFSNRHNHRPTVRAELGLEFLERRFGHCVILEDGERRRTASRHQCGGSAISAKKLLKQRQNRKLVQRGRFK